MPRPERPLTKYLKTYSLVVGVYIHGKYNKKKSRLLHLLSNTQNYNLSTLKFICPHQPLIMFTFKILKFFFCRLHARIFFNEITPIAACEHEHGLDDFIIAWRSNELLSILDVGVGEKF